MSWFWKSRAFCKIRPSWKCVTYTCTQYLGSILLTWVVVSDIFILKLYLGSLNPPTHSCFKLNPPTSHPHSTFEERCSVALHTGLQVAATATATATMAGAKALASVIAAWPLWIWMSIATYRLSHGLQASDGLQPSEAIGVRRTPEFPFGLGDVIAFES